MHDCVTGLCERRALLLPWTEWVQKRICAAVLYYRHNESQIRGTGKREGIEYHEGGGGGFKMTPKTSVFSLSAAITPNHKHGHVQISFQCTLVACGNLSWSWIFMNFVGIVCRLAKIAAFGRVTLTLKVAAEEASRWHKPVNHCQAILRKPSVKT